MNLALSSLKSRLHDCVLFLFWVGLFCVKSLRPKIVLNKKSRFKTNGMYIPLLSRTICKFVFFLFVFGVK